MVQDAYEQKKITTRLHSIEPYFDGRLGTAKLQKAVSHFNNAQRELSENNFSEARGQLKRAHRFYRKAVPYVRDEELRSIILRTRLINNLKTCSSGPTR